MGKKNGFKALELLQAVVLTPDEWTPESGLVTAAQKIQRGAISKAFKKDIDVSGFFGWLMCRVLTVVVGCVQALRLALISPRFSSPSSPFLESSNTL